jgi:hypothetical protein
MAIVNPFDLCDFPPVLMASGKIYLTVGADEEDAGNFSVVNIIKEGTVDRVFSGADETATPVGRTTAYRLELAGDSFSNANLSRMVNQILTTGAGGDVMNLETITILRTFQVRFHKDLFISAAGDAGTPCADDCDFDLILWRAYFDLPFSYGFVQDEMTRHSWNLIALPDSAGHPENPFGTWTLTCASAGAQAAAAGADYAPPPSPPPPIV